MAQANIPLLSASSVTGEPVDVGFSGNFVFVVAGTFGGGTVGLELLGPDDATWISIDDVNGPISMVAAGAIYASLPAGIYRATITGATGASLFAKLLEII